MTDLKRVTIYTDGACTGNPGPGGYGVVLLYGGHRKELSGGFQRTTNNRMELMAAIVGLRTIKEKCRVSLYSDSKYVVDAMSEGWARRWQANGVPVGEGTFGRPRKRAMRRTSGSGRQHDHPTRG